MIDRSAAPPSGARYASPAPFHRSASEAIAFIPVLDHYRRVRVLGPGWLRWLAAAIVLNTVVFASTSMWWQRGHYIVIEHWRRTIDAIGSGAYHSYIVTLTAVMLIDLVALGPRRSAIGRMVRGSRSELVDACFGIAAALGGLTIAVLAVNAGMTALTGSLSVRWLGTASLVRHLPVVIHLPVYFVVYDFLGYWYHRWCHHNQWLWSLHAFHHRAESFVVLTGNRVHPLEIAIREIVIMVPMVLIGTPPAVPLLLITVRRIVDQLQHSMVPWTYGWVGRWLLYSPIGHRIHHSPDQQQWDSNYGDIFPIWDRWFGTWYAGRDVNERVGLGEQPKASAPVAA